MILKILKKDFLRQKIITLAVFTFIMLSAILISSGTNMFIDLNNSLEYLFEVANAPHFIQYHFGDIDQRMIDEWSENNALVKLQETSAMINIDGSKIYFNNSKESEKNSVMEMGFVKQNKLFDYLLNLDNKKIVVDDGEIAVPILYMQRNDLQLGDVVKIKNQEEEMEFIIADFVRDVQMNPSIVSSKRFVVSDSDFEAIKKSYGEIEHIISFQLNDLKDLSAFATQYNVANLPQKGPTIDYELLKVVNSLTDGLVAAVLMLISLLLNVIALLCLRFTILSTIEEDYREIGVMKGIGISPYDIKRIYITKYFFLALSASVVGFILSIVLNNILSKNIMLYIGTAPKTWMQRALPLFAALLVFIIVLSFCMVILRRFDKISAIQAIRMGYTANNDKSKKAIALYRSSWMHPSIFLGLRDVLLRLRLYALLFMVFVLCVLIIIVPLNFIHTIQSPEFITYMGIGKSDVFIDVRQSDDILGKFNEVLQYVKKDSDVVKYAAFITCTYEIYNEEGYGETLTVETGDFSVFPLEYTQGVAPKLDNEIALSFLSAEELQKKVGDEVTLFVEKVPKTMTVTGIYQDITNGGRTAKANITPDHDSALWYTINMDVKGHIAAKIDEYGELFRDVSITGIDNYLYQTFGNTINQLKRLTTIAVILAILVVIMITSLFLKMLIAKDLSQIAIMRSIGINLSQIQMQYITKALVVLNLGIISGTMIANTLGENLFSIVLSFVGASNFKFVVNPLVAYILIPIGLMVVVIITTLMSITSIKELSISDINQD